MKKNPNILILSSTYPFCNKDTTPRFVHQLAVNLSQFYTIFSLCPSVRNKPRTYTLDGINVTRSRYFFNRYETLIERDAILENLKSNTLNYLLIPFFLVSQIYCAWKIIKKNNISVINAHWIIPQGLSAVIYKRFFSTNNTKIIISAHGADVYGLKKFNRLKSWILKNSDHIFAVSQAMRNHCIDKLSVNPEKISVVPMGVDFIDTFYPRSAIRPKNSLIYVGRVAEKKGLNILIEALNILNLKNIDFTCSIIGTGKHVNTYIDLSKQLSLDKKITFLGAKTHNDIPIYLSQNEFFIFPSVISASGDREGLGLTAIEAMGCETVVIASDLESSKDFLAHNHTGLTFTTGDANSLADQLEYSISHPEAMHRIRKSARAHVIDKFSWEKTSNSYIEKINQFLPGDTDTPPLDSEQKHEIR